MNYIDLIRNFWRSQEVHSFGTIEIALYFHLVEVSNRCNWLNPFKRNNAKIMADLGIKDRRTLDNARLKLSQAGLISFVKKSTNPNVTYTLTCAFNAEVNAQDDVQVNAQVDVQVHAQADDTKDKLNQTKLKKEKKKKEFSFLDSKFKNVFLDWLEYKKQRGQPYKSEQSVKACYNKLVKLSNDNTDIARQIIDESIANNWSGFFEVKKQSVKPNIANYDNSYEHDDF